MVVPNDWDLSSAELFIDGVNFKDLPVQPKLHQQQSLSMDPRAMLPAYGIVVPYKVDHDAPCSTAILANLFNPTSSRNKPKSSANPGDVGDGKDSTGLLFQCCQPSVAAKDDFAEVPAVALSSELPRMPRRIEI